MSRGAGANAARVAALRATVPPLRVRMIDNFDSFTWNLVQYLRELGAEVTVVRHDAMTVEAVLATRDDALVISPGPGRPAEAGISVPLIQAASGRIPLLGVCLGHQALAEAFGGEIVRAGTVMHGKTSPLRHRGVGLFAGLPQPFEVARYHSLAACSETLPGCLEVTAWCEDPGPREVVMGLAHREHVTHGVQFHPEAIMSEYGHALLAAFLRLAADARGV